MTAAITLPDFVRPVAEVTRDQGLYLLVYGPSGVGKTTLATTTPDPSKTLVLSAEGGTLSIADSGVHCVQVNELHDVRRTVAWLKKNAAAFDWIILDSVTEIAEVVLAEEKEKSKDGRAAYGEMATKMTGVLKAFRDLPANVVVIAATRTRDDDGQLVLGPDTPGNKLAERLPYLFDEVLYYHAKRGEDGTIKRALLTTNDGKRIAKDRSGKLDQWERPDLAALAEKIHTPTT